MIGERILRGLHMRGAVVTGGEWIGAGEMSGRLLLTLDKPDEVEALLQKREADPFCRIGQCCPLSRKTRLPVLCDWQRD